jgi:arginine utilization protein RocB
MEYFFIENQEDLIKLMGEQSYASLASQTAQEKFNESLEKAKEKVLKNLAKDVNYYSNLLNQKQSPFEFKQTETDKPGM